MNTSRHLVVITGASRGLGRLIAEKFWQEGDDLVLIARSGSDLKKASDDLLAIKQGDQEVHYFSEDLSNLEKFLLSSIVFKIRLETRTSLSTMQQFRVQ